MIKKNIKKADVESFLSSILDPQDLEIVVVRTKCELIYANANAGVRMGFAFGVECKCKACYSKDFENLCDYCPYGRKDGEVDLESFEIVDKDARSFVAKCRKISWIDGKPASIFFLRDITQEKENIEQLYALAYVDQLTGVPNRQKLKEDFGAMEADINDGKLAGVVALFDLDNFKAVNDTYGHNTGDVVLRRLTEHLHGEREFLGRLYRLGGDEFVFLFKDPPEKIKSYEEMKEYYRAVLSAALRSYTLPTIALECTISIGVSFFPRHGHSLAELLRKADIALYRAKAGGRNQIVFFENRYDIVQKFKDLYINIQPVLLATGKTFGYELNDNGSGEKEDENTVSLNELNRALDALGLNDIENDVQYFISFSRQLLNSTVLEGLPKEKFIVQMGLPDKITKNDLQIFNILGNAGYKLALVGLHSGKPVPELLNLIDYCKFSPEDRNTEMQEKVIADYPKIRFIATNVDSQAAYREAKETGFHMFQGYFFSQPTVIKKTKEINPLKVNYFRLLKLSSTEGYLDFREISSLISSDVALTYKLLRLLNSAAVGLRNVSSIAMAVAYLGEESLKKWIAVLALRGIVEGKPLELVRISLIRARFGELLTPHFRIKRDPKQVFMVGMLSLLHIALERSKEQLLRDIPVSEEIRQSLLTKSGVHSDLLLFYENYEYANWDGVTGFIDDMNLDPKTVNDAYIEAVKWYNDIANA